MSALTTSPRQSIQPGGSRVRSWRRVALGALVPLGLLAAWQLVSATGAISYARLPTPEMVWLAAVDLTERGQLAGHIGISVQRVLSGFAIGSLLGITLGAIVGLSKLWDAVLAPTLGAIRAVPSLAWVPLLLLWLGIDEESKVVLIAIGAFFPVFTTVSLALRHVDPQLVEAGRAFGYRGFGLFRSVQLPAVLPSLAAGLRLGLAQAWLFLVAAELIASAAGLGFLLEDSRNIGRTDRIFLAIVLLAVLGKLSDAVLAWLQRRALRRWS